MSLGDTAVQAMAAICRRLDGLPLAIELAAAQCRLHAPQQIAARLRDRLAFLVNGPQGVAARHQTLRKTIDWSYALPSSIEQRVFCRLSVFADGWRLDAALAVAQSGPAGPIAPAELEAAIGALLNQSLIYRSDGDAGACWAPASRFAMLETIRAYALERPEASRERTALRQANADDYDRLAEAASAELFGPAPAPVRRDPQPAGGAPMGLRTAALGPHDAYVPVAALLLVCPRAGQRDASVG